MVPVQNLYWCQIDYFTLLVPNRSRCQIGTGAKFTPFTLLVPNWFWCQIDSFTLLVPNWLFYTLGAKLVPVPNWLFYTLGAKLVRCQIDSGAKLTPVPNWLLYTLGAKLVPVPNWLFYTLGAKLSSQHSWCQIDSGAKLVPVPNCPPTGFTDRVLLHWWRITNVTSVINKVECHLFYHRLASVSLWSEIQLYGNLWLIPKNIRFKGNK